MLLRSHVQGKDDVLYVWKILINKDENDTKPNIPADAAKLSYLAILYIQIKYYITKPRVYLVWYKYKKYQYNT